MPEYWIFQTKPENYDLPSALAHVESNVLDVWTVSEQYRHKVKQGDRVFFWKAGSKEGKAGIYAFGEVVSPVGQYPEPE